MKIAYFDCFSGISGDMILGALIDAGLDVKKLKIELNKLNVPYELKTSKVKKANIIGTKVSIGAEKTKERKAKDLIKIIEKSNLDIGVKKTAQKMIDRLAKAEAKIHNESIDSIHFHELGGIDTIIDIVGAVLGLKILGVEEVHSSSLHIGKGFIKCAHGTFPVPAPATVELLKGVPVYGRTLDAELVTPTGAVIITSLAKTFTQFPVMEVEKIGYGAGDRELPIPNMLRVFIGEEVKKYNEDMVTMIETNIDNMNPEFYDYIMNKLFQKGALDVFLTPVQMKNNRPGTVLSVLADKNLNKIIDIIFSETTTLGVRTYEVKRFKLEREEIIVDTKYGKIKVKLGKSGARIRNIAPEYKDCLRIARERNIPLKEVYDEVKRAVSNIFNYKVDKYEATDYTNFTDY